MPRQALECISLPFLGEKRIQTDTHDDRIHIKDHCCLFLPMTHAAPDSGCDFRRNQVRFRIDPKDHSQAIWEAEGSQSLGLPGIPTIGFGTSAESHPECLPIGTVFVVGFLQDPESQ